MAIMVPKLTDDRTLAQIHNQLMDDIGLRVALTYNSAIDNEFDEDDTDQRIDYRAELESMCQQLGTLEECMSLKWDVDCDCFYR